jgi:hypothetical protein
LNKNKLEFLKELRDTQKLDQESNSSCKTNININVLVKDKQFKIFCGDGRQKLKWLTDVAILKYESYNEGTCGIAYSIKLENGNICDLNEKIESTLQNGENVWVLLKEEYIVYLEQMKSNN